MRYILFASIALTIMSCAKNEGTSIQRLEEPNLPAESYLYSNLVLPPNTFVPNDGIVIDFIDIGTPPFKGEITINDEMATLGRVLFYDTKLSLNNTISCGSCHLQAKAFADGQQFSHGFEGRMTNRNSMAIINPVLQRNLFWDSRSFSISDLSLKPVQNHIEMGMEDMDVLENKLSETDYYDRLFWNAFGDTQVTKERISEALTQFVSSITTANSKFDQRVRSEVNTFTPLEELGMQVFHSDRAKCGSCHAGNNFSAQDGPDDPYGGGSGIGGDDLKGTTNIGLDLVAKDKGRVDGMFRIPSLRNIALTAPYMHDGRFKTLEEVIDHYRFGIKPSKDLDVKFTDGHGNVRMLNISETEKFALIAFLNTLTDETMTKDIKYSDPFKP